MVRAMIKPSKKGKVDPKAKMGRKTKMGRKG